MRDYIERNLGAVGLLEGAMRGAGELARGLAGMPEMLVRGEAVVARLEKVLDRGVPVAPESLGWFASAAGRHGFWRTTALWAIAAALAAIAIVLGSRRGLSRDRRRAACRYAPGCTVRGRSG